MATQTILDNLDSFVFYSGRDDSLHGRDVTTDGRATLQQHHGHAQAADGSQGMSKSWLVGCGLMSHSLIF